MGLAESMSAGDSRFPTSITSVTTPEQGTTTISLNKVALTTQRSSGAIGSGAPAQTLSYAYDVNGRQCLMENVSATLSSSDCPTTLASVTPGSIGQIYDAIGRVVSAGDQANQETTSYLDDGQPQQVTESATLGSTTSSTTVSYGYDGAGRTTCVGYDAAAPCTTPGSGSNHVVTRAYDPLGDLSSTTDWLGNTVSYGFNLTYGRPDLASIVVPSGTGATETQSIAHNADGQVTAISYTGDTSLASLNAVTDTYAYATASSLSPLNSSSTIAQTSSTPTYSQTSQILTATNQGATASDTYTYAANDALKSDARPPTTTSPKTFTYSASTEALTSSKPATGNATFYAHNALGQRCTQLTAASDPALTCLALGSMTSYGWTSLGQLASVSGPTSASTFAYDARGLRTMSSTTAASTTTTSTYAYDTVDGGRVPQLLSDTANSYVYGPGMGGTAPVEQISGSGAVSFCFSAPSGVQAVVTKATSSTASLSELANYSIHGTRTLSAAGPTLASPFGFQGAYTDASTGFLYLFNRYYDPRSAQFLSVDPALLSTAQPYALDGGNSLNMVDPLGLYQGCISREACGAGSGWRENGGTIACSSNCGGGYPTAGGQSYMTHPQGYIDEAKNAEISRDVEIGQGWTDGATFRDAFSKSYMKDLLLPEAILSAPSTKSSANTGIPDTAELSTQMMVLGSVYATASGVFGAVGYGLEIAGAGTAATTGLETLGLGVLVGGTLFVAGGTLVAIFGSDK